jgi:hypothetical protein
MGITNRQSGTNVHEVADGIYRINTPVEIEGAGGEPTILAEPHPIDHTILGCRNRKSRKNQ